ncbi:hypothetical protein HanRHA438_Chr03g0117131 [Helianthus annuus]|nr:hypothetical protein HanRHA438_Chr03g0117131 [Helianthus annuus]
MTIGRSGRVVGELKVTGEDDDDAEVTGKLETVGCRLTDERSLWWYKKRRWWLTMGMVAGDVY